MASVSTTIRPATRVRIHHLSTEVLSNIFDRLQEDDCEDLIGARCVCRRFDAIATPVMYRTVSLNSRIIGEEADEKYPQALRKIGTYTKHLIVASDLDPDEVKQFFLRIPQLLSIRWIYAFDGALRKGPLWVPSDLLSEHRFRNTKLYVEDLPLRGNEGVQRNPYIKAIPPTLLRSLKLASPIPPLTTKLHSLKQLLLQSRDLEVLHYQDRGQGTQFSFQGSERLPPFKELSLKCYDWTHTPETVKAHWDFSRIRSLELIQVPIYNVLSSLDLPELVGLEVFHAEDFSAHHPDNRVEATDLMYQLVRYHVRALKTLRITCYTNRFPLDSVLFHGRSLEDLSFRDFAGFGDEHRECYTVPVLQLLRLSVTMTALKVIELDMDTSLTDPRRFMQVLGQFPRLHTVTLNVHTVVDPHKDIRPGQDPDFDMALGLCNILAETKAPGTGRWKQITINVGGWKPVLVRRLADVWREKNRQGVFAERCFVMDTKPGGKVVWREPKPLCFFKQGRRQDSVQSDSD